VNLSRSTARHWVSASLVAVLSGGAAHAQQQPQPQGGLAGLYAEQPPAGSAFVRVLNTGAVVQLTWAGGEAVNVPLAGNLATPYRVVNPAHPPTVLVNGKEVKPAQLPTPGSYMTWELRPAGDGMNVTLDELAPANALKVALRLTNVIPDCSLTLKTAEGVVVFSGVLALQSKARNINPVRATLVAHCGPVVSAPLSLPTLRAGDRFSVFAHGSAQAPRLSGQMDTTEVYSGKP